VNFGPGDSLLDFPAGCPHVLKKKTGFSSQKKKTPFFSSLRKEKERRQQLGARRRLAGVKEMLEKEKGW